MKAVAAIPASVNTSAVEDNGRSPRFNANARQFIMARG